MRDLRAILLGSGICLCSASDAAVLGGLEQIEWQSKVGVGWQLSGQEPFYAAPWYQQGTGQLSTASGFSLLEPAVIAGQWSLTDHQSLHVHGQYHSQPTASTQLTESWWQLTPLPIAGYRVKARVGWFYPKLSLENTDIGWTSPYSSSFSMINSWFAEELRAQAAELSVGNKLGAWQWQAVAAVHRANDPIGSLLSWRGFAIHNSQTGIGERVPFARYPSLNVPPLNQQPAWVAPTREVDGKLGYYVGLHGQWQDRLEVRGYYYDNNGEPTALSHQQYAWATSFAHVAARYQTDQWQWVGQWLSGTTSMGERAVAVDYRAWFMLGNYQFEPWLVTLRYDEATQTDQDLTPTDPNQGASHAWTAQLEYRLNDQWSVAIEQVWLRSQQANRTLWPAWPAELSQQRTSLLVRWRLD